MRKYRLDGSFVNINSANYSAASWATFLGSRIFFVVIIQSAFDAITRNQRLFYDKKKKKEEIRTLLINNYNTRS